MKSALRLKHSHYAIPALSYHRVPWLPYIENLLDKKNLINKNIEETPKEKNNNNTIKWIIVIGISIVALSAGVWTAIGVFVLGSIISLIGSNK